MPEYDGEIRIKASIDADNLDKELQKLSSKFERQSEAINRQSITVQKLKQSYQDLASGTKQTSEELGILKQLKELDKRIGVLENKIHGKGFELLPDITKTGITKEFDELTEKSIKLQEELEKIKLDPKSTKSMQMLTKEIQNGESKTERLNSELRQTESELARLGNQKTNNFNKRIDEARQAVDKMGKETEETGKKNQGIFGRMGDAVSGFGSRIMKLAGAAFVFNIISAGFRKIREHMGNLIAGDNQLSASLNQVRANLLTAFMPIWQAVLPALQALGRALALVTQHVAAFVSMLFGKSVQQSQNAAKSYISTSNALSKQAKGYDKVGKAAKKAAGELASFDKIEVLNKRDSNKDVGGGGSGGGGSGGGGIDLSGFKNDLKDLDSTPLKMIVDKFKELAKVFKQGFDLGFVDQNFDEIIRGLENIGAITNRIFNDPNITKGFNQALMSIIKTLGIITGAVASVGVTIGRLLIGGISKFFTENEERIKNSLLRMFDITANLSDFVGEFSIAFADVFQVFGGENAQKFLSNMLSGWYALFDGFFVTLYGLVVRAATNLFKPFITFKDDIKEMFEGTLSAMSDFSEGTKEIYQTLGDNFKELYENSMAPYLDELGKVWEDFAGMVFKAWNQYINPALSEMAKKWDDTVGKYINPAIKQFGEFAKKYFEMAIEIIKKFWEFIKPVVEWLVKNAFDAIATGLKNLWNIVMDVIGGIMGFLKGFFRYLEGWIDIIVGLFTGDWDRAWKGAGKVVVGMVDMAKGAVNTLSSIINGLVNMITGAINVMIRSLNRINFDVPDWLGGGHVGFNIPEIPKGWANIPKLAHGAVLEGGDPFLAWVNDQPRGQTNIETPRSTMVQAFREAMNDMPKNNQPIILEADGDFAGFIRFLNLKLKQEDARIGQSFAVGDSWI